jgi:ATP-binding cassette subfamily A (ABC1) protein 3
MTLYGIAGTLLAYCMTLVALSPLAAFAATAAYQIVIFIVRSLERSSRFCANFSLYCQLYLSSYLLIYTYANPAFADGMINTVLFTLSLLSPVVSIVGFLDFSHRNISFFTDTCRDYFCQPFLAPLQFRFR